MSKTVTVSEDEWLQTTLDAQRWRFIKGRYGHCTGLHMDGTGNYFISANLGRSRSMDAAADTKMHYYEYPIPEPVEVLEEVEG